VNANGAVSLAPCCRMERFAEITFDEGRLSSRSRIFLPPEDQATQKLWTCSSPAIIETLRAMRIHGDRMEGGGLNVRTEEIAAYQSPVYVAYDLV
jgi:hypothetical protein